MTALSWTLENWSITLAVFMTLVSVASGLFGITTTKLWDQDDGVKAYLQGDIGAWLYFLICCSTIVSIAHLGLLIDWAWRDGRAVIGAGWADSWNIWHAVSSMFLAFVHYIIIRFRLIRLARSDQGGLIQDLW